MKLQPAPWRVAGSGALLIGVAAMSVLYAPQALLGAIADDFDRSAFEANFVVSATTIGIAAGVFPMAWISARAGRRTTIAVALVAGVLLTLATAFASEWWMLVASRVLAGLSIAAVLVSALVWVAEDVPRATSRRVAALYVAGTTAGGMAGRIVAGAVAEFFGWRAGVLAVDAVVLLCTIGGLLAIAAYHRRRPVVVDDGPVTTAPRRAAPRRARIMLYALGFLGTAAFVGLYNAIAFRMLEPPFSLGVGLTSLLFLTYIAGTLSSVRAGVIIDRIGVRLTIVTGLALAIVGVAITMIESLAAVIAGLLVLAAGFFIVHTANSATVPAVSPAPTTGSALYTLWYYTGSSVGAVLIGAAWDFARWGAVVAVAGALLLLGICLAFLLPRQLGEAPTTMLHTPTEPGATPATAIKENTP